MARAAVAEALARMEEMLRAQDQVTIESFEDELTHELGLPVTEAEDVPGWNHEMLEHALLVDPRGVGRVEALVARYGACEPPVGYFPA